VMIQVKIFYFVTPCSVVVWYQCFKDPFYHRPLKRWYPITTLYDVTTQKTWT